MIVRFLKSGDDFPMYEEFYDNYVHPRVPFNYRVVAVKVDAIHDHLPEFFDALGLPQDDIHKFPSRRAPTAPHDETPGDMYHDFNEKIRAADAITVIGESAALAEETFGTQEEQSP